MNYFAKKEDGFGLMEVIVAMFICSVGMVSILSLTSMSLKAASLSKHRLIAAGLAQEGMEIIRDVRNSYVDWYDWEWYSVMATSTSQNYVVQYDDALLLPYADIPLKLDSATGLYQYSTGNDTLFYRKINLTKLSSNEIKVLVEIKWQLRNQWHYLTIEDRLWKWRGN